MNTVQRAFELAASGDCRSIDEIRSRLCGEKLDHVHAHLAGPSIRSQLNALITSVEGRA